jgi:glycosyltransferase involved in cell wall biosynthesis
VTGLQSVHEWEYKFKEITPDIYHLANLFDDNKQLYLEFISNYIETRDIEVIHIIHTNFIFDILPEIKKRHPHVRVILTMFNDRVPEYFQPSVDLHNYIDVYTSDNNATANHYKRELPPSTSVKVIPNGINCYDIFNPALFSRDDWRKNLKVRKDELAIFFVGRLSEEKNPDVFLAAAEAILHADAGSKVRFFIIGDGGMRPQVERAISRIGSKKIVYLGYQAEVAHFLSAADVFVLPSSIEGFPLSILEAMAMKVCVIASDVGAVTDVIETKSDGFVIAPGSVEEIVSTIKKLVKDREQLELIKNSARVKVEQRYSNKLLGQNYRKLYKDVIK